jgi:hypothetical protein
MYLGSSHAVNYLYCVEIKHVFGGNGPPPKQTLDLGTCQAVIDLRRVLQWSESPDSNRPSGLFANNAHLSQHPPVYPIPKWAPTTTVNGNNTRPSPPAFPSQLMLGYFQQQFPDPGNNSLLAPHHLHGKRKQTSE